MASTQPDPRQMNRRQQILQAYRITRQVDPRIGLKLALTFLIAGGLGFGLFVLLPGKGLVQWIIAGIGGLIFGVLGVLIVLSRRAQATAYAQMEGQPGAAAAALGVLRRGWKVEPAVAFTRQQDVVHRVVGPPGIVLIGEGQATRVKQLLRDERRKHERVASGVPITEIHSGREEGQVPLPDLVKHLTRMARKNKQPVRGQEMTDILNRLKALDATRSAVPLPKGPMPTSMRGLRSQMRGR